MMRYLSVCSGIEAATVAWHPLDWQPVGFSEIEKFPAAVLAHHYPDVPNFGDMTKFKEWPDDLAPNLIVGGTPCQSFSVAGLRKGLADPRGNLALTYLALADRYRPEWLVWENVPGVLSSNGGRDFGAFLGMLEELNYIVDVDILDAKYFGLAQRRRRVFVCAQHLDNLLKQNTNSSALTITQCLMEILQGILVEAFPAFARLPESSEFARVSRDGVLRRIKLFKLLGEEGHWQMLLSNLAGALARCQAEAKNLVERDGEKEKDLTAEDLLMVLKAGLPSLPTEESLSKSLGDVYSAMKLFTTSTSTSITTTLQISLFKAALNIARLTLHLSGLSPSSSDSESSNLMALREYTNYARQASSDIFAGMEWVCSGGDLIGEAEQCEEAFGYLGDWRRAAAVLFERHSLSGHPAPSRETREGSAASAVASVALRGREGGAAAELGDDCAFTLRASSGGGDKPHALTWPAEVAPTIPSRSTGGGGLGAVAFHQTQDPISSTDGTTHALGCGSSGGQASVAVATYAIQAGALRQNPNSGSGGVGVQADHAYTLEARAEVQAVASAGVRRLTPRECERLQGFPEIKKICKITVFQQSNFNVCLSDKQSTNVLAAQQFHKSPNNASPAEENEFPSSVNAAEQSLNASHIKSNAPVLVSALIDLERQHLQLHSQGRSLLSVSIADAKEWCRLPIRADDFVQLSVALLACLEKTAPTGRAALHLNTSGSFPLLSGNWFASQSGREIEELASDAEKFMIAVKKCTTFITSEAGRNFQNYDSNLQTLLCCVSTVISSFIPSEIQSANSYALSIEVSHGYTLIPWRNKPASECPDGPRYKALGNSFAVPVVRWIAERIIQVEASCSSAKAAAAT